MSIPLGAQDAAAINDHFGNDVTTFPNVSHVVLADPPKKVILLWDHALTFSMEIEYLWRRSSRWIDCLSMSNRYFAVVANVIVTVSLFDSSLPTPAYVFVIIWSLHETPKLTLSIDSSCQIFHEFREISLLITEVIVSVLLTVRIYVIYDCNKRVFWSMASVGAVLAGLALVCQDTSLRCVHTSDSSNSDGAVSLTPLGCHTDLNFIPQYVLFSCYIKLFTRLFNLNGINSAAQEAAAWEALFVYDTLIFAMVLVKGYQSRRSEERIPLLDLILRDGAVYFAVMALANLANILTFYFAGSYTRGSLSTFSSAISVTMISRLTLNLRESFNLNKFRAHDNLGDSVAVLSTVRYGGHDQSTCDDLASPSNVPVQNSV
ncbi:hypothetical protein K435DRAFT_899819 [Dendrothele bispora CBS 962.96]|uniref:DUF6533 domain-containing protein n=1 Tax=Dendrothele bispora (strain CBS 962.96) TaxID=1314807 RepID=A0A4S8LYB0_DENBC|nr:hypothetical protein K435DRAFT_899819 [Dendrothele bispora CBS 962.96]